MGYSYDEFELKIKKDPNGKFKTKLAALMGLKKELLWDKKHSLAELEDFKDSIEEVEKMIEREILKI